MCSYFSDGLLCLQFRGEDTAVGGVECSVFGSNVQDSLHERQQNCWAVSSFVQGPLKNSLVYTRCMGTATLIRLVKIAVGTRLHLIGN